ncbi:MAG: nitroreductase family protein [Pseudomonadota bacterium]
MEALCSPDPCDGSPGVPYERSLCTGFLAGRTEGLPPGFYLLDREGTSLGQAASGDFPDRMTRICLDQAWLSQAAVLFLFITDLAALDKSWGPRGYRYAMMTAGRLGERLYVAATAVGLGCCGIGALYDGEAARLLGLQGLSRLLYLVGIGPVKGGGIS